MYTSWQLCRIFKNCSMFRKLFHRKHVRCFCILQNNGKYEPPKDQSPFQPTRLQLQKADRFFKIHGPRAVLEESGVKIGTFTKLKALPEVALLGRTSVGKSSLINALLRQKKLARISKTPGHTRLINCFNVGSKFYLVDLPGYGYVEGQGHGSEHFVRVVENYLKQRAGKQLRSVCLLVDGKVGVKKNDLIAIEMMEELDAPFHVAVTKIDKINRAHQELRCKQIAKKLEQYSTLCFPHIFPVSSKQQTGLSELRYFLGLSTGLFD